MSDLGSLSTRQLAYEGASVGFRPAISNSQAADFDRLEPLDIGPGPMHLRHRGNLGRGRIGLGLGGFRSSRFFCANSTPAPSGRRAASGRALAKSSGTSGFTPKAIVFFSREPLAIAPVPTARRHDHHVQSAAIRQIHHTCRRHEMT
jgi:hypothetical protein